MTPELLCDPHKGITAMFKAFPAVRFKGKGHEVTRGYYTYCTMALLPMAILTMHFKRTAKRPAHPRPNHPCLNPDH